jgi:hypothetical protein
MGAARARGRIIRLVWLVSHLSPLTCSLRRVCFSLNLRSLERLTRVLLHPPLVERRRPRPNIVGLILYRARLGPQLVRLRSDAHIYHNITSGSFSFNSGGCYYSFRCCCCCLSLMAVGSPQIRRASRKMVAKWPRLLLLLASS